jgi:metal-responsive CopG/Arc/MetJ family transcriptional regulator
VTISQNSKRFSITLPTDLYKELEIKAKNEQRTISNMIAVILKKEFDIKPG